MPLPKMPAKPADTLSPKDAAATRLPDDAVASARKTAKAAKAAKPPFQKSGRDSTHAHRTSYPPAIPKPLSEA